VVPAAVNFAERRGPSTIMACQLCAGIAATEALKILLRRGRVRAAPHGMQFDPYRNKLARTSNTPGRTQELNFFDVGEPLQLRLVDMPGYGFAEAPKDMVKRWRFLINDFLRGRAVLKRALVLVDSRHGLKSVDREIMTMLDKAAVNYQLVMTKADKVKPTELDKTLAGVQAIARTHPAAHPEILVTSSETGAGIAELRTSILQSAFA
jgi:GTP-binding protein